MIELIFVIIILGILATVAMTKIIGTRDDAQIAQKAYDLSMAIEDFSAYYTANGHFSTPRIMTNVDFNNFADTNLSTSAVVDYADCIQINSVNYSAPGNVTTTERNTLIVRYDATHADTNNCAALANAAQNMTNFTNKNSDSSKMFVVGGSGIF